jgi:hypothetical protein
MRVLAIFIPLLCAATNSHAAWQVTTTKDAMTDETKKSAVVLNDEGHSLSIYRLANGAVFANFSLASKSFDQLAPEKPPMFRVDKNEPHDLMAQKRLQELVGVQPLSSEPKWINFPIWHGKEAEGRSAVLNELMQGTSVVFRYYIFTGGYKETTFSLTGAGPAIADALGIPLAADPSAEANAKAFRAAGMAALKACRQDMNTFRSCAERVASCRDQAGHDAEKLGKCLQ